jgi:UDP-glucose 4-epimerase
MRIVVVGASGFVGGWFAEEIAAEGLHDLTAYIRRWSSASRLARRGIALRQGEIGDSQALVAAFAGADVVMNAAMLGAGEAEAVANLCRLAAVAGVRRFIHVSSAAVYGGLEGTVTEGALVAPLDAYGAGKLATEHALRDLGADGVSQIFILRPSIIYGPFSEAWTIRYARRLAAGRWRGLGRLGSGACNLVHARDLAAAARLAAVAELPAGVHVLNINGPDTPTWNTYIEDFGDALGIDNRTVPNSLAFSAALAGSRATRQLGSLAKAYARPLIAALTAASPSVKGAVSGAKNLVDLYPGADELKLWRRRVYYAPDAAQALLGFEARTGLAEGLAESVAWLRRHGLA